MNEKILLGELREFKHQALREFKRQNIEFKELSKEVRSLNIFKWKILGAASAMSFLASALTTLIIEALK